MERRRISAVSNHEAKLRFPASSFETLGFAKLLGMSKKAAHRWVRSAALFTANAGRYSDIKASLVAPLRPLPLRASLAAADAPR